MTSAQRKYWDFVGSPPCQLCGRYGAQVSHCNMDRGLGEKSPWWEVAALCKVCHHDIDNGSRLTKDTRRAEWLTAFRRTFSAAKRAGVWVIKG